MRPRRAPILEAQKSFPIDEEGSAFAAGPLVPGRYELLVGAANAVEERLDVELVEEQRLDLGELTLTAAGSLICRIEDWDGASDQGYLRVVRVVDGDHERGRPYPAELVGGRAQLTSLEPGSHRLEWTRTSGAVVATEIVVIQPRESAEVWLHPPR